MLFKNSTNFKCLAATIVSDKRLHCRCSMTRRALLKIPRQAPVTKFAMSYNGSKCLPEPEDPVVARKEKGFASAAAALYANNLFSQCNKPRTGA